MVAVPLLAARVDLLPRGDDFTSTVVESVAFVALFADAHVLVEEFALRAYLAANPLGVEEEVLGALEADCAIPLGTSKVVIESSKELGVVVD